MGALKSFVSAVISCVISSALLFDFFFFQHKSAFATVAVAIAAGFLIGLFPSPSNTNVYFPIPSDFVSSSAAGLKPGSDVTNVALIEVETDAVAAEVSAAAGIVDSQQHQQQDMQAAFEAVEAWRVEFIPRLYANVSDDELDSAARWTGFAQPFATNRTCLTAPLSHDLLLQIQSAYRNLTMLNNQTLSTQSWRRFATLHAYHSLGLDGDRHTLDETARISHDTSLTPNDGAAPIHDMMTAMSSLKLDAWPVVTPSPLPDSESRFVELNAALQRPSSPEDSGLRRIPIGWGTEQVVMAMPDELPALTRRYLAWLQTEVDTLRAKLGAAQPSTSSNLSSSSPSSPFLTDIELLHAVLNVACDVHARFLHVHPFSSSNGRLARLLSGMVLSSAGLPPPLFSRHQRSEYFRAVSDAMARYDYVRESQMHAHAVLRSLWALTDLFKLQASA